MRAVSAATSRVIAGCFALAAFSVAVISGTASGSDAAQILLRALVAMIVCYPIGLVAGMVCTSVIDAHIRRHQAIKTAPAGAASAHADRAAPPNDEEAIVV